VQYGIIAAQVHPLRREISQNVSARKLGTRTAEQPTHSDDSIE
jgi:hypothetical protein